LADFFAAAEAQPLEVLGMHPLVQFRKDRGTMRPDQLLAAFPPFCVKTEDEYNLPPVSGEERRRFLADFAAQIRDLPDGATIEFKIINSGTK
jgi:hypothetical protein